MLRNAGVPTGHFSTIIIDEAAQALEPETLIPLMLQGPHAAILLQRFGDVAATCWGAASRQPRLLP